MALPAGITVERPRGRRLSHRFGGLDDVQHVLELTFAEAVRGARRDVPRDGGETLVVEVPPGVFDGQVLRVPVGEAAMPGVPRDDDVYLLIHVVPDPRFRRDGRDVHTEVPISIAEAVFGAELVVESLDGPLRARIPPGVESGQHLRFRGRGVAASDGVPAGHFYVTLRIQLPDVAVDDEEARAAIALLESRYRRRPRG